MSGIAGVLYLDGRKAEASFIQPVLRAMEHRGPDGTAAWAEGTVAFGQLVRHITPESLNESLPLHDREREVSLVADAIIDNREELIACLSLHKSPVVTDAELILAAYARWGDACVDHLDGDYSFAIWDRRAQRLFCVRDHFGTSPLYYYYEPGKVFAFASEVKALLYVPEVPRRINEERLANYMANLYGDTESTIFKGILRLSPSHCLSIDRDGLRSRKYWTLEPIDIPEMSDEAYADEFRDRFREAVRVRIRSAFPVGSQLSGGLDSSFVACMARDILAGEGRGELHTFSSIFDETPESDERGYMQEVLQAGGFIPHFIPMDKVGPISTMSDEYRFMDDAAAGAHHLIWHMLDRAREAGVRVLLDGVDGDTTVDHGYYLFRELARAHRWKDFYQEASQFAGRRRQPVQMQPFETVLSTLEGSFRTFALEELDRLAARKQVLSLFWNIRSLSRVYPDMNTRLLYRRSIKRLVGSARRSVEDLEHDTSLLDPDFAQRVNIQDRIKRFGSHFLQENTVREYQKGLFHSNLIAAALEPTNHAAAAFGLQVRHPFFDRRLIQYCVSLPSEQSLKDGWNRVILRRAMKGVVPDGIRWRIGKANMEAAFARSLMNVDGVRLRGFLDDPGPLEPYINRNELHRLREAGSEVRGYDLDRLDKIASLSLLLRACLTRIDDAENQVGLSRQSGERANEGTVSRVPAGNGVPAGLDSTYN